jgi:hypothetical protein
VEDGKFTRQDLLVVHIAMRQVRAAMETNGIASPTDFASYDELRITPLTVHARVKDQYRAVMELTRCINIISNRSQGKPVSLRHLHERSNKL